MTGNKVGRQRRQPTRVALCAAVFSHHILTLYLAGFTQPNLESGHLRGIQAGFKVT